MLSTYPSAPGVRTSDEGERLALSFSTSSLSTAMMLGCMLWGFIYDCKFTFYCSTWIAQNVGEETFHDDIDERPLSVLGGCNPSFNVHPAAHISS
jgi:hypothetical protein